MDDLVLDKDYRKGDRGRKVKLIQEWLSLQVFHVSIDGSFGSATEAAVKEFQKTNRLKQDGVVGKNTFGKLCRPMTNALNSISAQNGNLGEMIVKYAEQHWQQNPREIGGQNRGPWVRLYMNGNEGSDWPWCSGFVCFILKQACRTLETSLPIQSTFSCDSLAASAKENGLFVKESDARQTTAIKPGSLFLVRRTPTDWEHTGIVLSADGDVLRTIEGNTNDDGSREGYEVCRRIRNFAKKDFVVFP